MPKDNINNVTTALLVIGALILLMVAVDWIKKK